MPFLSHVDLRVRNRSLARSFYATVLGELGAVVSDSEDWTSIGLPDERSIHWFGFTEDQEMRANATRVAFTAAGRDQVDGVARVLRELGAVLEGPDESEGYYAVFFSDPDGNDLEVACTADS